MRFKEVKETREVSKETDEERSYNEAMRSLASKIDAVVMQSNQGIFSSDMHEIRIK